MPQHSFKATIRLLPIFLILITICGDIVLVHAQEAATASASGEAALGVKLYQEGRDQEAITALRAVLVQDQKDAEAWHYLGLAYSRQKNYKMAVDALRRAVKLRPTFAPSRAALAFTLLSTGKFDDAEKEAKQAISSDNADAEAHYVIAVLKLRKGDYKAALETANRVLSLKPNLFAALDLKAQALFGLFGGEYTSTPLLPPVDRLREALRCLEMLIKVFPESPSAALYRSDLETIDAYIKYFTKSAPNPSIYEVKDVSTKPVITYKELANYTEPARQNKVSGSVILMAVFRSDGRIVGIIPIKGLPDGLTEQAIIAARKVRFQPATKNGQPVSVVMQLEYHFAVY